MSGRNPLSISGISERCPQPGEGAGCGSSPGPLCCGGGKIAANPNVFLYFLGLCDKIVSVRFCTGFRSDGLADLPDNPSWCKQISQRGTPLGGSGPGTAQKRS